MQNLVPPGPASHTPHPTPQHPPLCLGHSAYLSPQLSSSPSRRPPPLLTGPTQGPGCSDELRGATGQRHWFPGHAGVSRTAWGLSPPFTPVPPLGVALVCGPRDPTLSPQHAPCPGQSSASLCFLHLGLGSLAGRGVGQGGAWGRLLQLGGLLCPRSIPPHACPQTQTALLQGLEMAPVQGRGEPGETPPWGGCALAPHSDCSYHECPCLWVPHTDGMSVSVD